MLQESAPLINAPEVWNKQVNGVYLTGEGQTICVVDTGIDYTHPAIGSAQCTSSGWQIDGTQEDYHLQFYDGSPDQTWTITKSGYSNIAVHFADVHTQKDASIVLIKDMQDNIIQAYEGDYSDEWTFSVPGNKIKINFMGPPGHGFRIDEVLNGHARTNWQNCGDFIGGYDAANFDMDPMDDDSHGTHVSGIITSDDTTYKGIAPDAKIVAVKALNNEGWGWDDAIIGAIDGCVRYADLYNISVISLSLGVDCDNLPQYCSNTYCDGSVYTPFINKAVENNVMVVAASGNDGLTIVTEPACINKATPVGSTEDGSEGTTTDQISSFSNRWSLPMIFAPGDLIHSTGIGEGFVNKEGTSMSTPHVSAVAALIYQYADLKGIEITPQEIEDLLLQTGKQIDGNYKRVDALAAINCLEGTNQHNITINEFLPNPTGYDNAAMPNGEWVELYNNGTIAVNLDGFVLYDSYDDHELYITNTNIAGDLVLQPDEYLVVYRDGDNDFSLNNNGYEEIRLYDGYPVSESNLIDEVNYTGSTEGYSWSLINGNWEQTIQTPGAENTYTAQNETGTVERVIDGDTLELETSERVRLIGIDTPEVGEYYYEEAKNRLKELVEGKTVILERDIENRDWYDRLLRYIYIDDSFVNLILVQEGYARAYPFEPNTKYKDEFANAETEAKNNKLGIWNNASFIIPLTKGWNLVSSPLNFTNITEIFEPIEDDFISMFVYDAEYQKFIEINPFGYNEEIDLTHGSWIKVLENVNLSISGKEFENTDIPLLQGWNLVGYPSIDEINIDESNLKDYTVFTYNNLWSSYIPNRPFNSLQTLKPGFGYWVKSS